MTGHLQTRTRLLRSTAPGAGIESPRIQNESGFDREGATATTGGLVNPEYGRQAQNLPVAKGANDPILLDQEIRGIFYRALAGQIGQAAMQQIGQTNICMFSRQLICLSDGGIAYHKLHGNYDFTPTALQ